MVLGELGGMGGYVGGLGVSVRLRRDCKGNGSNARKREECQADGTDGVRYMVFVLKTRKYGSENDFPIEN